MKINRLFIFCLLYIGIVLITGCSNNGTGETNGPQEYGTNTPSAQSTAEVFPANDPGAPRPTLDAENLFTTISEIPEERSIRNILMKMLLSGDGSQVDVSDLNLTRSMVYDAYNELIYGECMAAYKSFYKIPGVKFVEKDKHVEVVGLSVTDAGFSERYTKVQNSIKEAFRRLDAGMSDVEKSLVLHDYIVENATYEKGAEGEYAAWGILVNGRGVCQSYAEAYSLLLYYAGIDNYLVSSPDMNHIWNIIKIDGEWYHVDSTWDDTRSQRKGQTGHYFFIRNDQEFQKKLSDKHYNYSISYRYEIKLESTSKKYNNWFVHDVAGRLLYYEGFWYYIAGSDLKRSRIDGTEQTLLASVDTSAGLMYIKEDVLYYSTADGEKQILINQRN